MVTAAEGTQKKGVAIVSRMEVLKTTTTLGGLVRPPLGFDFNGETTDRFEDIDGGRIGYFSIQVDNYKGPDFIPFPHPMNAESGENFYFNVGKNVFFRKRFVDSTDNHDELARVEK